MANSNRYQPVNAMENGFIPVQVLASLSATLIFLICGNLIGWPSPTCVKLMAEDSPIPINSAQCAWIVMFVPLGSICGSIPTSYLVELLGRKLILLCVSVPFVVSWLILALSQSVEVLYVARFLAGMGFGAAYTIGPVYITEITDNHIRGAMVTLMQVMFNLGTLFEYSVGPYISYDGLAISSLLFPILFFITFIWMPESPYFLVVKKRKEDAEKSLMRLRGKNNPENVKEELRSIQMAIDIQRSEKVPILDIIRIKGNRKAFLIVISLMIFQNFSGIQPVLSYTTTIFKDSGSEIDSNISTIIFGTVNVVVSIVSAVLVDRAGRKPLLIVSCAGCSACMLGLGLYFYYASALPASINLDWLPLAFVLLYIIMFMIGIGPLPWAVAGDILASNIKGYAVSLTSAFCSFLSIVTAKLFQLLTDAIGEYVIFWMFSICCAIGTIFIILVVPETKGKSLLEIYKEVNKIETEENNTMTSLPATSNS